MVYMELIPMSDIPSLFNGSSASRDVPIARATAIVSRQELLDSKANRALGAPVNTSGFGLATEVPVGESEGLKHASVINCDQLTRL
jgi:mRNA-degrading endonuclease toxin of MazEF toxin-antitoxin module